MNILIEGWRGINHSYSLVNQWQILELLKSDKLYFKDEPFISNKWNTNKNSSGLDAEATDIINNIATPNNEDMFDITYRISSPLNFDNNFNSKKLFVFGTCEFKFLDKENYKNNLPEILTDNENFFIHTPSHWSKEGFLNIGFSKEQILVVPHGVDKNIFNIVSENKKKIIKKKYKIDQDDFVLTNIGAMTKNKGVEVLIAAYGILKKKNKNLKLILKDQSNLYNIFAQTHIKDLKNSKYKDLIDDEIISNILFISNNLNCEQVNDLYGISDCYVSPYLAEGFGLTPLEASSAGTPIVVTKGGSTDDYFNPIMGAQISSRFIKDNNATYLKPNIDSLVENINLIINNPKNFGGKSSHSLIAKEFSVNKSVQKLLNEINI